MNHCILHMLAVALVFASATAVADEATGPGYSIPMLDLSDAEGVHVTVARDLDHVDQYLGHPTTVLLDDDRTILAVFPTAHGKGQLRMCRSADGGVTWEQLPNLGIELHEVPTIFKVQRPDGHTRLVITTCTPRAGTFSWLYSDDDGATWTDLETVDLDLPHGIIVALATMWRVHDADGEPTFAWRGAFHDFRFNNYVIELTFEEDADTPGGYRCVWGAAERIEFETDDGLSRCHHAGLCEPGVVRSPDGERLAMLYRPQHKRTNAMVSFSDDEGQTWTDPVALPGSLTGERHVGKYAPDGRLLVCFRDYSPLNPGNPSHGDWVAWVGTWDDLVNGDEGQYRVRLKDNYGNSTNNNIGDCGYTGVEVLPDGTFVCTTYGHWERNDDNPHHPNAPEGRGRPPYILAARFTLEQLDGWIEEGNNLMPSR